MDLDSSHADPGRDPRQGSQRPPDSGPPLFLGTSLGRGLRLRCPRCGEGRLFRGPFRMNPDCPQCGLHYERDPGYFLGSTYVNYAVTALLLTVGYVGLHFGAGLSNRALAGPLLAFCILFPVFFFRYARSLWLAVDIYLDRPDDGSG